MTDSELGLAVNAQARPPGKRERLIAAASQRIYEAGVEKTTLADIAAAADVPLGNVYYYFKTKDAIVQAVIEAHLREVAAILAGIEAAHAAPRDRLKALFGALGEQGELIARYGCPHGTLCLELDKRADGPGLAVELMRVPLDWTERQFAAMGRPDARELALQVVARYQGTALLTSAFRDPDLITQEAARVAQWIEALDLELLSFDVAGPMHWTGWAKERSSYRFPSAARTRRAALSPEQRLELVVEPEK